MMQGQGQPFWTHTIKVQREFNRVKKAATYDSFLPLNGFSGPSCNPEGSYNTGYAAELCFFLENQFDLEKFKLLGAQGVMLM